MGTSKLALGLTPAALGLVLLLGGCGGSLDPGPLPTPSYQSPQAVGSAAASPSPSASACTPDSKATYQLAGATVLSGGVQIKDEKVGTGKVAKEGQTVKVNYTGSLPSGTVFDQSSADNKGKPISFTLSTADVIPGWVEGIVGMRVGGKREMVIPAALGYGCAAEGKIPANSTLIFSVQLVGIG
ncbi:MAG: FKBP-type peptidyl-prolyl cis-trans isomerase [Candidatus Dormibacteria bacterium]